MERNIEFLWETLNKINPTSITYTSTTSFFSIFVNVNELFVNV